MLRSESYLGIRATVAARSWVQPSRWAFGEGNLEVQGFRLRSLEFRV